VDAPSGVLGGAFFSCAAPPKQDFPKEGRQGTGVSMAKLRKIADMPAAQQRKVAKAVKAGENLEPEEIGTDKWWNDQADSLLAELKKLNAKVLKNSKLYPDGAIQDVERSIMRESSSLYCAKISQSKKEVK
jgi:hypothetical protein